MAPQESIRRHDGDRCAGWVLKNSDVAGARAPFASQVIGKVEGDVNRGDAAAGSSNVPRAKLPADIELDFGDTVLEGEGRDPLAAYVDKERQIVQKAATAMGLRVGGDTRDEVAVDDGCVGLRPCKATSVEVVWLRAQGM